MTLPTRPTVSLLSIADDPTLGATPERGRDDRRHQICFLAEALAQKGWQVDLFTGQAQTHLPSTAWLVPHCRVIRLPIQPNETLAPQVAQGIQTFQTKDGLLSPLFHSLDRHSAQVGAYLKQHRGWRWLHTVGPMKFSIRVWWPIIQPHSHPINCWSGDLRGIGLIQF